MQQFITTRSNWAQFASGGGPPPPPGSIAFRAATAVVTPLPTFGGTFTLDKPTGTVEDDVMLAWFGMESVSAGAWSSITPPAGWSLVETLGTNQFFRLEVYVKVAGASEPATYDFEFVNPPPLFTGGDAGILSYSGADPAAPIDDSAGQLNGTSNDVECPSVTASVTDTFLVCFFGGTDGSETGSPIDADPVMDQRQATAGTDYSQCTTADEAIASTGGTGVRTGNYIGGGGTLARASRCISVLLKPP